MARPDLSHPDNVEGPWFVDDRCSRCDSARHWAPDLIGTDEHGRSFVARQPADEAEEAAMWRAAAACPTLSIGNRQARRPARAPFPHQLTPGVYALGHNAPASFGAHSYLATRPGGNLMFDSPRFTRPLAEAVDALGGIAHVLLSHRDDVADADRWADRYGSRVWIHEADADAAPYATDIIVGDEPRPVAPGAACIPTPGHTEGCVCYHIDGRWLFTGDTLHWNHRRGELDVTPLQTFFSWDALADSMDRLAGLRVEWVFPGHGRWGHMGADGYASQMGGLGPAMRKTGRDGWARRPATAFDWC